MLGQRDLTALVSGFSYEDCIDQDDKVQFNIYAANAALVDDRELVQGAMLTVQFGYLQGNTKPPFNIQITDIKASFRDLISLQVVALDVGHIMKKTNTGKVWKALTSSQIVGQYAAIYKLKTKIDATQKQHIDYPQTNFNDFDFIKKLAKEESRITYIKNDTLYFIKRNLGATPAIKYTWGYGDGVVISFEPQSKETANKGAATSTKVVGYDLLNAQSAETRVESTDSEAKLGNKEAVYDAAGNRIDPTAQGNEQRTGKVVIDPSIQSTEQATAKAQKLKNDGLLATMTANLEILGDPLLQAGQVITMAGVGNRYGGNWYVKKVTHKIGNDYRTSVELEKNATLIDTGTTNKQVPTSEPKNTALGDDKHDGKSNGIAVYNANGKRID